MPPGPPLGGSGITPLMGSLSEETMRQHLELADREMLTMRKTVQSADAARAANGLLLSEKQNTIDELRSADLQSPAMLRRYFLGLTLHLF